MIIPGSRICHIAGDADAERIAQMLVFASTYIKKRRLYATVVLFTVEASAEETVCFVGRSKPDYHAPPETTQEAKSIKPVLKVAVGVPVIVTNAAGQYVADLVRVSLKCWKTA